MFFAKIGIDGCGKETYSTLACYVAEHKLHRVSIAHNSAISEFREMLKKVFIQAGLEGTPTVVMVADLQEEQVSADALYVPKNARVTVCVFPLSAPFQHLCSVIAQPKPTGCVCYHALVWSKQTAEVFPAFVISILIDRLEVITPCSKISNFLSELSLFSAHRCAQMFV